MRHVRNGDMPLKVGISGSYGGFNLGDEAILHVILGDAAGYIHIPRLALMMSQTLRPRMFSGIHRGVSPVSVL